jgi:hypothetical protein
MASTLGRVIAPALARSDRTVERAEAVLAFIEETGLPEALAALSIFYGLSSDVDRQIERAFHRPLAIGDRRITTAAVDALDQWLRLIEVGEAHPIPDLLRDRVLRALERGRIGGLAHLVYLVRRLVETNCCGLPEMDRIAEVLDELREATDYGMPDGDGVIEPDRAVALSLVRAQCVRLARAIEVKGVVVEPVRAWRDLAARDPLPEVRNAADDEVD